MKHILWLASWYPDEISPYNGDFIQRHAIAVSSHIPITVIYIAQHGPDIEMPVSREIITQNGNLTERIVYFKYGKTGARSLNKILYNWKYFYHFRRYIRQYIAENGRPDLIHVHIPMKAGRIALWLKETLSIPFIVTEHSSAYSDEVPDSYHRRSDYYKKWVRSIFEQASGVTTVSARLGNRLQELFSIQNMHIIPNVADTRHFHYSAHTAPRFRFLHASTMDHPKNVEGILKALHELKQIRSDWECIMLGWDRPVLKELCASLQLDAHVKWKGVVTYQEVAREMQQSSALLMFSRYENQPCVILEALCCGLPVLATMVGGIPEIVNAANGILVPPEKEALLLEAMQDCMNDYSRFDRTAIAGAAQNLYAYEIAGKQFAALYDKYAKLP
jgi:glycosyltransferase involved in cell wall biosynthesis